jgi:hypothetical protein
VPDGEGRRSGSECFGAAFLKYNLKRNTKKGVETAVRRLFSGNTVAAADSARRESALKKSAGFV